MVLGALHRTDDGRYLVRYERNVSVPATKVWTFLTEPERLKKWFPAAVDLRGSAGSEVTFEFPAGQAPTTTGVIITSEPPRLIEYTWGDEFLIWQVDAAPEDGSRLTFINIFDDPESAIPLGAAWHAGLDVLEARMSGQPVDWSVWERADELNADYERAFR